MSKKSYNIAQHGYNDGTYADDMQLVEELGLDPEVAYTPKINIAAAEAVRDMNYKSYINSGLSEAEANAKANSNHKITLTNIKKLEEKYKQQ